jgi:hypothetical protein
MNMHIYNTTIPLPSELIGKFLHYPYMQKSNKNVIGNPGHRIKAFLLNHWLLKIINFYNFYILLNILNHQYYVQCQLHFYYFSAYRLFCSESTNLHDAI